MRLSLILLLLITILLAGCADMQAYVPGIEPTPTATATITPAPEQTSSPVPTVTVQATRAPGWKVCTGMEGGYLNVRACAGTGCRMIEILAEGERVTPSGVSETTDSGTWIMITSPVQGWVNGAFVCQDF